MYGGNDNLQIWNTLDGYNEAWTGGCQDLRKKIIQFLSYYYHSMATIFGRRKQERVEKIESEKRFQEVRIEEKPYMGRNDF